jgi:hypothetical protein
MWFQQRASIIGELIRCQDIIETTITEGEGVGDNVDTLNSQSVAQSLLSVLDLLRQIEDMIDARPATGPNIVPFRLRS